MSFHLSAGTLDSMAGVFSPAKKYRLGAGGGKGGAPQSGGEMSGLAVASIFPKAANTSGAYRASAKTKQAFGGGHQAAVSRRAIATMERTARRVPEVMVRVTGRQHGAGHVLANFAYISRLGHGLDKELELHTSEGDVIDDGREMQELAQEWHEYEMGDDTRRKGATSLSMILSMPAGTDPERVQAAALDFARDEFANRCWVASLHIDRDHPHVHLTIARRDHDGRRFHPSREDLFRYRQRFAEKLRDRGVEANATPAKARGLDPTHEHIAAQKVREKGQVPRLDRTREARADRYRSAGRTDPVGSVLAEQRAVVLAAYEQSILELSASPSLVNRTIAQSLQRFVDAMPEPEPNSTRTASRAEKQHATDNHDRTPLERGEVADRSDVLATAMSRLRDATARSRGGLDASRPTGTAADADGDQALTVDGNRRSHRATAEVPPQAVSEPPHKVAAILHEVEERDRARRDRDRSHDRSGPRR